LPWNEEKDKLGLRDIAINIFGFVPFGVLCFAYLYLRRRSSHALWWTVGAGFAITLTIEVLQYFIPSRGSDVIDLLTNTLGTYLGALLLRWPATHSLAPRFGLSRSTDPSRS
jgi:glycopeptide antibiotics resistance protein